MIRRTYQCGNCDRVFTFECSSDDGDPFCPNPDCDKVLEWRPQSFAIGGSLEGKAVRYTQDIMEKDFGLSNFKDNAQQGESGIIRRQETKVETEIVNQTMSEIKQQTAGSDEARKQFWGANAGNPTALGSITGQSMIAMAKQGPQGADPLAMLHQGVKAGKIPSPQQMMRIEGRHDFENPARKTKGT
jgi:hypothetical protein